VKSTLISGLSGRVALIVILSSIGYKPPKVKNKGRDYPRRGILNVVKIGIGIYAFSADTLIRSVGGAK
jgi:hypothetical protein